MEGEEAAGCAWEKEERGAVSSAFTLEIREW